MPRKQSEETISTINHKEVYEAISRRLERMKYKWDTTNPNTHYCERMRLLNEMIVLDNQRNKIKQKKFPALKTDEIGHFLFFIKKLDKRLNFLNPNHK